MIYAYKIKKSFYDKGNYKAIQEYLKEIDWNQMLLARIYKKCGIY